MRTYFRVCLTLLFVTSCASQSIETRSPARIINVCFHNLLFSWMASGATATSVLQGDAKKVSQILNTGRNLSGMCNENENTLNEDF